MLTDVVKAFEPPCTYFCLGVQIGDRLLIWEGMCQSWGNRVRMS